MKSFEDSGHSEYSLRYQVVRATGLLSPPRFRFLPTAAAAIQLLHSLTSLDHEQVVNITLARREVGPWNMIDRLTLEGDARGEGGPR